MRVKDGYYEQLQRITEAFPNRETITPCEVAKWLHKDVRTVKRIFTFRDGYGISIVQLARQMLN